MIVQGKVWGYTTPLFNRNNVELHIAEIKKGGYCSKHMHKFKFNRFVVLKGNLKVTIWKDYGDKTLEDISLLGSSQECTVPPGDYHKFEALEDTTVLEIYWVELNEGDIVRKDHGGVSNEKKTTVCDESPRRADRQAIFIEKHTPDGSDGAALYGTKYFGNN